MNRYHLKEKATQLAEELERVEDDLRKTLIELQQKCDHPHDAIIEAPMQIGSFIGFDELRLCTVCGLQEERGACGWEYVINKTGEYGRGKTLQKVTRDDVWSVRDKILQGTSVGVRNKDHLKENNNVRSEIRFN